MVMEISFIIPGKPQPKQRPRVTKFGTYTPQETRAYEINVAWLYKLEGGFISDQPIEIEVNARFAIPKSRNDLKIGDSHTQRPDIDNILKIVTDGLNGVAYNDDSQIVSIKGTKKWSDTSEVEVILRKSR